MILRVKIGGIIGSPVINILAEPFDPHKTYHDGDLAEFNRKPYVWNGKSWIKF